MGGVYPKSGDVSGVSSIRKTQSRESCRGCGETPPQLNPPKTSETGSAFHNRRAKNEAKMCFLPDDASSNTLKELEGSPK